MNTEWLKSIGICLAGVAMMVAGVVLALAVSREYLWIGLAGVFPAIGGGMNARYTRPGRSTTGESRRLTTLPADDIEIEDPGDDAPPLSLSQAVEVLADAYGYASPGIRVGVAAARLPTSAAYFALRAAGPAARASIEYLLHGAAPGGRLYAAMALQRFDPPAAREAWTTMAGDRTVIDMPTGGCTGHLIRGVVGDFATSMLTGEPMPLYRHDEIPV